MDNIERHKCFTKNRAGRIITLLLSLLPISYIASSQTINATVILQDSTMTRVDHAVVVMDMGGNPPQSSISDINGIVGFNIPYPSVITVSTSHLSYQPFSESYNIKSDTTIVITLRLSTAGIEDVTVIGRAKPITMIEDGAISISVSRFSNNKSDKVIDALRRMPGVGVYNENITVNGQSAIVFIDGVQQRMTSSQLIRYFESLPASAISTVKLRPSRLAEHDMTVGAVIEIVTTRQLENGYDITFSTDGALYPKDSYRLGGDIFARMKYKSLIGNIYLGTSNRSRYSSSEQEQYSETSTMDISAFGRSKKQIGVGSLNLNWRPLPIKGSINLYLSYFKESDKISSNQNYLYNNAIGIEGNTYRDGSGDLLSFNIEYVSADTLRNQFKLSYGLVYGGTDYETDYDVDLVKDYSTDDMIGRQHVYSAEYAFVKPKFNIRAGAKIYDSSISENSFYQNSSTKSRFKGYEDIIGLFASSRVKLSEQLSIYMGIRAEYTNYDMKLLTSNVNAKSNYWNLAPNLSLTLKRKNYSGTLQFSSTVSRPNYYNLLPGITYINENMYRVGNPNLDSYPVYALGLNSLLFDFLYVSFSARYAEDVSGTIYRKDANNNTIQTYDNYTDYLAWTSNISMPFTLLNNKLQGSLNLQGKAAKFRNIDDGLYPKNESDYFLDGSASLYIGYKITDRFNCFTDIQANSSFENLQAKRKGYSDFDFGVQYSFLKNKQLTFALSCNNILNNGKNRADYYYNDINRNVRINPYSRNIKFSISFNLKKNWSDIKIRSNENDTSRFR